MGEWRKKLREMDWWENANEMEKGRGGRRRRRRWRRWRRRRGVGGV